MRNLKIINLLLLLIISLYLSPTNVYALPTDDLSITIDQYMEEKVTEQHIPNATISIVHNGEVIFDKGYGFASREKNNSVDPQSSLFRIGSVSKLFTWTAVMQLVEQGKLDLNTDINEYIDFQIPARPDSKPITLRNLMTHTPGFEDYSMEIFNKHDLKAKKMNFNIKLLIIYINTTRGNSSEVKQFGIGERMKCQMRKRKDYDIFPLRYLLVLWEYLD